MFYDSAIRSGEKSITTIIDLEAYYVRQLPNIRGIMEEVVGIDRKVIKLITKVLPRIEYFVCTKFGISEQRYGLENDQYMGTGQGNVTLVNICRDKSYFIIKKVEKDGNRAIIVALSRLIVVRKIAVAFLDDTAFTLNRNDCVKRI